MINITQMLFRNLCHLTIPLWKKKKDISIVSRTAHFHILRGILLTLLSDSTWYVKTKYFMIIYFTTLLPQNLNSISCNYWTFVFSYFCKWCQFIFMILMCFPVGVFLIYMEFLDFLFPDTLTLFIVLRVIPKLNF